MYTQTLFAAPTLRVSSPLSPLSVPSICISPAADAYAGPDSPPLEPLSPEDALSPRSAHLLPPPILSPLRRTLSPPTNKAMDKKGLDQSTFDHLLVANRERTARRTVNPADRLRREVVVKAHHSKQIERRALFLSRIAAPPSPHSTETAVTPPESPAVFHFTLPSPGLASPLELFENVRARSSWVEQVDYSAANGTPKTARPSRLPSLDQITARLRLNVAAPNAAVEAPRPLSPAGPLPSIVIGAGRMDEVKPRSRLPDSIRASTRARSVSPPTPTIEVTPPPMTLPVHVAPTPVPQVSRAAPSQLIIPPSPPKSIKPVQVLLPQSIPALRINNVANIKQELTPVSVMSWRDRCEPTPVHRKDSMGGVPVAGPKKEVSMGSWKDISMGSRKDITIVGAGPESWRECAWREREVPIKREIVRNTGVPPISPRTVMPLPIGVKPAPPIPKETRPKTMNRRPAGTEALAAAPSTVPPKPTTVGTLRMDVQPNNSGADGIATSRRSALWRVQKEAAGAVKLTESERRAIQGRNMLDKLRRRTSAPAELEGSLRRGVPVGGF